MLAQNIALNAFLSDAARDFMLAPETCDARLLASERLSVEWNCHSLVHDATSLKAVEMQQGAGGIRGSGWYAQSVRVLERRGLC